MQFFFSTLIFSTTSVSNWTLRHHLFSEFYKRDSSVFVLVHLFYNLICFFLGHKETSALDDSFEFISRDASTIIEVKRVESFIDIEIRHAAKSLTYCLNLNLCLEMSSPDRTEFYLSIWLETIITTI